MSKDKLVAPNCSKLTVKGNVPDKLVAKGIDPKDLTNYTIALTDANVNIDKEAQAIADKIIERIKAEPAKDGRSFADVFDTVNGVGYMEQWRKRIVAEIKETALGTAAQSRAYKETLIANNDALTPEDFVSDGKTKKASVEANPFS